MNRFIETESRRAGEDHTDTSSESSDSITEFIDDHPDEQAPSTPTVYSNP